MSYTAEPDDFPASEEEARELADILRCLRRIRSHGGWGEVRVSLKSGDLAEIQTTYTEKPRSKWRQAVKML